MTDEEIKKIAREYAKWHGSIGTGITEDMLNWLSKDYVIIPKSKVREYAKHSKTFEPIDHLEFIYDIFDTELFNEEKR